MNKIDLLRRLIDINNKISDDPEMAHIAADEALLKFINDEDITNAYSNIPRKYI